MACLQWDSWSGQSKKEWAPYQRSDIRWISVEMLPLLRVWSSAFQGEKQLYFSKIAENRSSQSAVWCECKSLGTEIERHTYHS